MNTGLILLIKMFLLFFHFNILRAHYAGNKAALVARKNSYSTIYMPDWISDSHVQVFKTKNDLLKSLNPVELSTPQSEIDHNEVNDNPNTIQSEKYNIVELAVRQAVVITLKKILEELLVIVSKDIEKTTRAMEALTHSLNNNQPETDDSPINGMESNLHGDLSEIEHAMRKVGIREADNVPPSSDYVFRQPTIRYGIIPKPKRRAWII